MELLKQLITYAVLAAIICAGVIWIPRLTSRVQVPPDYQEITVPDVEHYPSYSYRALDSVSGLHPGDAVAYRVSTSEGSLGNAFGWVAAVPGDEVRFIKGKVVVNGKEVSVSGPLGERPDLGPLVIPENHVYVVTTMHTTDSVVRGPLPLSALRGRLESFP